MDDSIGVSVILSVYNTEKYLEQCLQSLAVQTLQNIEIIAVNNGSTDASPEILERFARAYPSKINFFTFEKNTGDPAEPWNYGVSAARGKYVAFVDSDDWCDPSMFEKLYRQAEKYCADLALCGTYEVCGDNVIAARCFPFKKRFDSKMMLINANYAVWGKIYRRSLFDQRGFRFKSQIHCDAGFNLMLYGYLNVFCFVAEPLYYYRADNPSSETNTKKYLLLAQMTQTFDYVLENCDPDCMDETVFAVLNFAYRFFFEYYPYHCDQFIPFITKHRELVEKNPYILANINGLRHILGYIDADMVPRRIFYSTFGTDAGLPLYRENMASWKQFAQGYEFCELNERSCDVSENESVKSAYEKKNYAFVSNYFVLKSLYETGGIALSPDILLYGPPGELRMSSLSFVFKNGNQIITKIMAAKPRNGSLRAILEQYLSDINSAESGEDSLSKLLLRCLTEECGMKTPFAPLHLKNGTAIFFSNQLLFRMNSDHNKFSSEPNPADPDAPKSSPLSPYRQKEICRQQKILPEITAPLRRLKYRLKVLRAGLMKMREKRG